MEALSRSDLPERLLPQVTAIATEAGAIALRFFRPGAPTGARIWSKDGGSPVTEADLAVDAFLKERLSAALPEAAWLSEETTDDRTRLGRDLVWIVDPIDGTRAFLGGHPDWSVAIALVRAGLPVLGLVLAPVHRQCFAAVAGGGARRNGDPITVSDRPGLAGARIAGPVPMQERVRRREPGIVAAPKVPSLALRIVRVADGSLDAALVSTNARDWDIAGADLILREAGGALTDRAGVPPRYNGPDPVHPELVAAPPALHRALLDGMTGR